VFQGLICETSAVGKLTTIHGVFDEIWNFAGAALVMDEAGFACEEIDD